MMEQVGDRKIFDAWTLSLMRLLLQAGTWEHGLKLEPK